MALSKSTITGRVPLPTDENLQYAELTFALSGLDTEGADVLPGGISKRVVLIDSDIPPGFDLWQNTAGLRGTHYRVLARWTVKDRDGVRDDYADLGIIQVGSDASYTLADLLNSSVPQAVGTFWSALTQSQYDAVIQAASDAAASAVEAALYDGPRFKTVALMQATLNTYPVGKIIRAARYRYEVVASDGDLSASGFLVRHLPEADSADLDAYGGNTVAALTAAFNALNKGRMTRLDLGANITPIATEIVLTLTRDVEIVATGGGGFIASNVITNPRMVQFLTKGFDLKMTGVCWYGSDKVSQLYRVLNDLNNDGDVCIRGGIHKDVRRELVRDGQGACDAVSIRGGFDRVEFSGNKILKVFREAGVGISNAVGTTGLEVARSNLSGVMRCARTFIHKDNEYDTIDCGEVGSARVDCDGVKYFSVDQSSPDEWFPANFVSTGNKYTDCAGRAIKGQASHGLVNNETIIRKGVLAIGSLGGADINLQMGSGSISKIEYFYYPVGGLSPFSSDGSAGAAGSAGDFYHTPPAGRPVGGVTVSDITIYNSVPKAVGVLREIVGFSRASGAVAHPYHCTLRGAKLIGGAVNYLLAAPLALASDAAAIVVAEGNFATEIVSAMAAVSSANSDNLKIFANNNCQLSGVEIPSVVLGGTATPARCNVAGMNNVGFASSQAQLGSGVVASGASIPAVADTFFPTAAINTKFPTISGFSHASALIENNATYTVRKMGYDDSGMWTVSFNKGNDGWVQFGISASGFYAPGASTAFAFGSGSSPDTAGKVNIWHDGTNLKIKNLVGSNRVFYIKRDG